MDHLWIESRQGRTTVVHLSVEYASSDVRVILSARRVLSQLAQSPDRLSILLDLENTDYFGAEFVNVLLECDQLAKRHGGRIAICNVRPVLQEVLAIMGLNRHWKIYESRTQALATMSTDDQG